MTAKPSKTRQAEAEARKRAEGLVRFTQWVHPDDAAPLREHAVKLARKRARATSAKNRTPGAK